MKITRKELRRLITVVLNENKGIIRESKGGKGIIRESKGTRNSLKSIIREEMLHIMETKAFPKADLLQEGKLKNFILSGLLALAATFGASAQDARIVTTQDTVINDARLSDLNVGDTIYISGYNKSLVKIIESTSSSRKPQLAVYNIYTGQIGEKTKEALDKLLGSVVVTKSKGKDKGGSIVIAKPNDNILRVVGGLNNREGYSAVEIEQKIEVVVPKGVIVKFIK